MSAEKVYLKPNIQLEPLLNSWYSWNHLIPPATAALNVSKRYIPIMESYINSPDMHAAAVKNPEMRGGPFIDLDKSRVDEVKALLANTLTSNQKLLAFSNAISELRKLLAEKGKGFSLEPLYEEVPALLRGYVELVYDMEGNPSFRFFEPLLYKSEFYQEELQSIMLAETVKDNDRPFILSTPRLPDPKSLELKIPFRHTGLDALFKMKKEPQTLAYIKEQLEVPIENEALFDSFFTPEAPTPYVPYEGDKMRIRYFGHACILVESKDISMLLDPVLSYTYESDISRYTYEDLPDQIDYVMITHSHQDHILLETMLQLRHKVKNIIIGRNLDGFLQDPSLKYELQALGFENIIELSELEEIPIPNGSITGIPFIGEHHDLQIASKLCYLINIDGRRILSVADSCNIEPRLYERVQGIIGDVDVLFLGMECDGSPPSWVYGPLFESAMERTMDHSRRGRGCNFKEGHDLTTRFNVKEVYVYAMGLEPWLRHILDLEYTEESNPIVQARKLIETCQEEGVVAELLYAEKIIFEHLEEPNLVH